MTGGIKSLLANRDDYAALVERAEASKEAGVLTCSGLQVRHRAAISGVVRSMLFRPRSGVPSVEAEVFDGSGTITLVWLGRRSIAGIEPGRRLRAEGMVSDLGGKPAMFNPRYRLRPLAGE